MKIILADDHAMFRNSLRDLLERDEFTVVAEASSGHEVLQKIISLEPDAAVLDINMPGMNGIEVARELKRIECGTRVVILSMFNDADRILEAFREGALAYILKMQTADYLITALKESSRGRVYLTPDAATALTDACANEKPASTEVELTRRERQILQLVAEGYSTKAIARLLQLGGKTIETHRSQLMNKLHVGNIAGLVRHAVRQRVIRP